jgi:adenosylhomocysteine nucleosidase
MSAMPEENQLLGEQLAISKQTSYADRLYTEGKWLNHEIVSVFSRWGKVAAATTATQLITKYQVDGIIFTGVAGACSEKLKIGDIVIADTLIQHDMDARPFFPRHEVPLIGISHFPMNLEWQQKAFDAAHAFIDRTSPLIPNSNPKIHRGCVATGDKFFASEKEISDLLSRVPEALCVEMEGAAVAQVCHEYQIPSVVIRTISDSGDEGAPLDFPQFVSSISSAYSVGILKELLLTLTL